MEENHGRRSWEAWAHVLPTLAYRACLACGLDERRNPCRFIGQPRVAPGPIETAMLNRFAGTAERKAGLAATVPLNRVGRPEEIAATIMFLASDKASFVTGASYLVDGG